MRSSELAGRVWQWAKREALGIGGNQHRSRSRWLLVTALAVLAAACSSGGDGEVAAPTSDSTSTVTATETTPTPTETPPPTEDPDPDPDLETLEQNWSAVWNAAGAAEADKPAAVDAVADLLTPELEQAMRNIFGGETQRTVDVHPNFTENDDGTIAISDCLYILPAQVSSIANWYEAVAEPDGAGGWTITSMESRSLTGCIPADVAEEVLADYDEFWAARFEYWNPAQPDHPGVTGTMTGEHHDRVLGLLQQHERDGWYVINDGRVLHPEILRVEGPERVIVFDCQLADQERGLFDAQGNRQPGIDPALPDERDIYQVTILLEDGQWKVSDIQLQENVECEFAPTPQGVPQV